MIILPLLLILMAFSKSNSGKLINTPNIDLESKLTQPATVVVESGCTATFFSTVEIKYPESTLRNLPTAFFKIKFTADNRDLLFSVAQINDAFVRDYSPTTETPKYELKPGQSLLLKLKFQVTNKDVDFN